MLKGLFPRVFSNYKECGIIIGKFTVGGGGAAAITFTPKVIVAATGRKVSTYNGLTMARTGVGIATVTLRDGATAQSGVLGANDIAVQQLIHVPASVAAIGSFFLLLPGTFNDNNGTFIFKPALHTGGAFGEFAMADGDEIHLTLAVNR